jgi:hypothetical protein
MFALLMSLADISIDVGVGLGALLTHICGVSASDFRGLTLLVALSSLPYLAPLIALKWIPEEDPARAAAVKGLAIAVEIDGSGEEGGAGGGGGKGMMGTPAAGSPKPPLYGVRRSPDNEASPGRKGEVRRGLLSTLGLTAAAGVNSGDGYGGGGGVGQRLLSLSRTASGTGGGSPEAPTPRSPPSLPRGPDLGPSRGDVEEEREDRALLARRGSGTAAGPAGAAGPEAEMRRSLEIGRS